MIGADVDITIAVEAPPEQLATMEIEPVAIALAEVVPPLAPPPAVDVDWEGVGTTADEEEEGPVFACEGPSYIASQSFETSKKDRIG